MKVTLYTGPGCGHCVRAKNLLTAKGIEFEEINAHEHKEELVERITLAGHPAPRTIPQVFVNGKYLPGGADGLTDYLKALSQVN